MTRGTKRIGRAETTSATDFVYERLRRLIASGRFAGGTLLVEDEVARALHVSRTPVHDALRRLWAEGLVDVEPRRRARVSAVGPRDIAQLYTIRGCLECIAVEDAARRITAAAVKRLEKHAAAMEDIARNLTPARLRDFTEANTRFHDEILAAAQNRWLEQALRPVHGRLLGPVNALAILPPDQVAGVRHDLLVRNLELNCRQHREIIEALRRGDPALAGAAMRLHVEAAQRDWGGAAERLRNVEAARDGGNDAGAGQRPRRR